MPSDPPTGLSPSRWREVQDRRCRTCASSGSVTRTCWGREPLSAASRHQKAERCMHEQSHPCYMLSSHMCRHELWCFSSVGASW